MYFVYPETRGVRLEDMDAIFGEDSKAFGTPTMRGEIGSLIGRSSPEPSMDYRRGIFEQSGTGATPSNAVPDLDIDPPPVSIRNGRPQYTEGHKNGERAGGWISRIWSRNRGNDGSGQSGKYRPLEQEQEDD